MKLCPGRYDWTTVGTPQSSVAVGSIHDATLEGVPNGTVNVNGWGQLLTTGGFESTTLTRKNNESKLFASEKFKYYKQNIEKFTLVKTA